MSASTEVEIPDTMGTLSRTHDPDRTDYEFWDNFWQSRSISQIPAGSEEVALTEQAESSTQRLMLQKGRELIAPGSRIACLGPGRVHRKMIEYFPSGSLSRYRVWLNSLRCKGLTPLSPQEGEAETMGPFFVSDTEPRASTTPTLWVFYGQEPGPRVWHGRFSRAYCRKMLFSKPFNIRTADLSYWKTQNTIQIQQNEPEGDSTAQHNRPREIGEEFRALFQASREQAFEDGMESEFSRGLTSLIRHYGNDAVVELAVMLRSEKVSAEAASEALRWLGHMDHPSSYKARRWVLEHSLLHPSARIRDGAALGLALLDDPHAIPYLKRAIQAEGTEELRGDMEQVLAQIESPYLCHSS